MEISPNRSSGNVVVLRKAHAISVPISYLNPSKRPSSKATVSSPPSSPSGRSKMSAPTGVPKPEKRFRKSKKKHCGRNARRSQSCPINGRGVSERLLALKELIPSAHAEMDSADQLFEETADYILSLRRQVQVLQRLVDFYSSTEEEGCKL